MTENINYYEASQKDTLTQMVDSAFTKGLTSVIMSQFPVASLFAIFMGRKATSLVASAEKLAEKAGLSVGGKRIPAKIMGLVGLVAGIVNSISYAILGLFWIFYGFMFVIMFLAEL